VNDLTRSDDPLLVFLNARLREEELLATDLVKFLCDGGDHGIEFEAMPGLPRRYLLTQTPGRTLDEITATRKIIGQQTSDHAPVETMYGLCCRTCVSWQDSGEETEFGIAIPHPWPCRVARVCVAPWKRHSEVREGWGL
jgi:hypothetical protein